MPHCDFCAKEMGSKGGVRRHINNQPDCRRQWELLVETQKDIGAPQAHLGTLNQADTNTESAHADSYSSYSPHRRSRSESSNPDHPDNPAAPKHRRVTIEEIEDEDHARYFEQCVGAGQTLREGKTGFERFWEYKECMGEDKWAPFNDGYIPIIACHICKATNFRSQGRNGDSPNGLLKTLARLEQMSF